MSLRTMTISVGKRVTPAVCCPGNEATDCGELHTRPGVCRNRKCRRYLTEAEFREAVNRWRVVEEGEAA